MYELYPYFTNDGTVGLFSRYDDDIYHSTHGALSESWQKFILPSHLKEYIETHNEVKILDICYGIGYNTKTALNVYIKNAFANKKKIKHKKNFSKKIFIKSNNNAAIYTDNVERSLCNKVEEIFHEKISEINFSSSVYDGMARSSILAIDDDNINIENSSFSGDTTTCNNEFNLKNNVMNKSGNLINNKILIDAVDVDKTLINLSPFIASAPRNYLYDIDHDFSIENKSKYRQIINIKKIKKSIIKEFRLKNEVSIILLRILFENDPTFFNDENLQKILADKIYAPFLNKSMIKYAKFYSNSRYKYNKYSNKMAFLHNIYYEYISRSYKNVNNLLKDSKICINFHNNDARAFVKATNNTYNFIFLDAFTPAKCPALWTVQFFRKLYYKLDNDGMILTYSNSAAIRNAFLKNGFHVGKTYDTELKKFVGTVAVKNKNLIEHELDERDLSLINSKAGICFEDENLELDNNTIILNRENKFTNSDLLSSSKVLKGYKNDNIKSL